MEKKFTTRDIVTPKPGLMVYGPSYWLCEDGDPKKALFYGTSAQCNKDRRIPEMMLKGMRKDRTDLQIVFVETAYVPQRD
jgi:hypothetical protein